MKLDGFNTGAFAPEHIAALTLAEKALRAAHPSDAGATAIRAVLLHVYFVDSEVAAYRGERDGYRMGGRSPADDFPEAPCDVASHREAALRYPHETQRRPRDSYAGGFERGYIRGAARCLEYAADNDDRDDAVVYAHRIDPSGGLQHRQAARMQARFDREDRGLGESRALAEQADALLAKYAHLLPQTTAATHPGEDRC